MKITVTENLFRDAFRLAGRGDQFSYEALGLIFEYMEDMERDTGNELELDVVAICCELSEESWGDIAARYNIDLSDAEDDCDRREAVRDYLDYHTTIVGETADGFIYVQF
jgi:hypothetical protein